MILIFITEPFSNCENQLSTYWSQAWGTEETEEQRIGPKGYAGGEKTHLFLCGEKEKHFYRHSGSHVIFYSLPIELLLHTAHDL